MSTASYEKLIRSTQFSNYYVHCFFITITRRLRSNHFLYRKPTIYFSEYNRLYQPVSPLSGMGSGMITESLTRFIESGIPSEGGCVTEGSFNSASFQSFSSGNFYQKNCSNCATLSCPTASQAHFYTACNGSLLSRSLLISFTKIVNCSYQNQLTSAASFNWQLST